MSYNGWTNYQSWNVNLWVMNDEVYYNTLLDLKRQYGVFTPQNAKETARYVFEDKTPDDVFIDDPEIDWQEIANAWNEKE